MDEMRRQRVGRHGLPMEAAAAAMGLSVVRGAEGAPAELESGVLDGFLALRSELVGIGTRDGVILKVNAAWERVLGYSDAELAGTSLWDVVHPDAYAPCAAAVRGLARNGAAEVEVRMRRRDGGDCWIGWSLVLVAGRLFAIGRDVSEQRRLEKALRQAQEAAAAAHRAKSEFLAGMSHEIRTPMTAILGFAEMLAERWRWANAPAEEHEALETIKRNGDLLLGLINDILELARIEAGRSEVELTPCSPAQLVADVMGLMHVRAEAQGLSLDVEFLTPIPATITTDAVRLRQILINLIGNAIEFTDRGGVRLRVRLVRDGSGGTEILGASAAALQFEVVDTGIGVRDEEIARLFQPFYRGDASPRRRHGGTGLGLALSVRLAERLGGTISGRSRAEGGSAFTLTIPCSPGGQTITVALGPGAAPAAPVVPPAVAARPAGRVLLAEDNRDTQRVMSLRLAAAGFEVTPASNGQMAVDLALAAQAAGNPFDAILMDMQMPVLDGYEATRTLRAAGYHHPIIAVTAHALSEDRDECLRFGCDDFLAKPIDWARLTGMIAAYARNALAAT